jgi:cyclopropane-fatty-acyl-phospholipid synthase
VLNLQGRSGSRKLAEYHYDMGNRLYESMLDPYMMYTCGYWNDATTLNAAQEAKMDLACRKLGLQPGMKLLDIGCGWGGMVKFAAEHYGVEAVGITISQEQARWARDFCKGQPVEIRLQDYRDLQGTFDRIVVMGMIEHVGQKNYRRFLRIVRKHLKDDGLFLLQTIGAEQSFRAYYPWLEKYIFPNSMLPAADQLCQAMEKTFVFEDWHNFSADYDPTLMAWHENFTANWDTIKDTYDERFYRMWRYFLLHCAGAFRARKIQLWQIVMSPQGVPGGYRAPR